MYLDAEQLLNFDLCPLHPLNEAHLQVFLTYLYSTYIHICIYNKALLFFAFLYLRVVEMVESQPQVSSLKIQCRISRLVLEKEMGCKEESEG